MSSVDKILDRTQFTEEIDGIGFVLRLITAQVAAQVINNRVLGLVASGKTPDAEMEPKRIAELTAGYLTACMVSPKIGEVSDPETDTIAITDLGDYGEKILTIVFERSGFESLGNSSNSSGDTGEENSEKP